MIGGRELKRAVCENRPFSIQCVALMIYRHSSDDIPLARMISICKANDDIPTFVGLWKDLKGKTSFA